MCGALLCLIVGEVGRRGGGGVSQIAKFGKKTHKFTPTKIRHKKVIRKNDRYIFHWIESLLCLLQDGGLGSLCWTEYNFQAWI